MPELHLKQQWLIYSACGPFTENRERIQKFRETGHLKHSYRKQLDKSCLAAHYDIKDLAKGTISDKILKNRVYEIPRSRNFDGSQRTLASMLYMFFDKKNKIGSDSDKHIGNKCKWTTSWRIT